KRNVKCFSVASMGAINSYEWPGNIRELENRVKRAVIMTESLTIEPWDLGFTQEPVVGEESSSESYCELQISGMKLKEARSMVEKKLVTEVLATSEGNIHKASLALGVSRPTLYDLMKKHNFYVDDSSK
ncbi:MAG: AAA family ATPase, partial [Desulfuromonadales bacterium]|nr:AAA family ATPase [Desulfuromonadales bacterium]